MPLRRPVADAPLNVGVETGALDGDLLRQGEMYVRNNFTMPLRPPSGFDVVVPGKASRHVTPDMFLSYRDVEVDLVLECAGNGRTLMEPVPDGTPWGLDASSPISVVGVHLVDVIGRLPDNIKSVVFTGADQGEVPIEGKQNYQFSIDRETAQSTLPILATHIGGEPLTLEHGAPVRLIVPGQYAMKSVKWLTRIEALPHRFQGYFVRKYRYFRDNVEDDSTPVGAVAVRSVISSPHDLSAVPPGPADVRGSAWTGAGEVRSVEVSIDEGETWVEAELVRHSTGGQFAPVRWAAAVNLERGTAVIMSRATDSSGATQPLEPRFNSNGYANNVVQRVTVEVSAP